MEATQLNVGTSNSKPISSTSQWCEGTLKKGLRCSKCKRKIFEDKYSPATAKCTKCDLLFAIPTTIPFKSCTIWDGDIDYQTAYKLQAEPSLAVDFETGCKDPLAHGKPCSKSCGLNSKDGQLQQIQICTKSGVVHIIRMPTDKSGYIKRTLQVVPIKIIHFSKFELEWTLKQLDPSIPSGLWLCTRIADSIQRPGEKHSLGDIVKYYLGHDVPKEDQVYLQGWDQPSLNERQIEYSINDVKYLHQLLASIVRKMSNPALLYKMCDLQKELCTMEAKGYPREVLGRA